jgi:hypothetical protein
MNQQSDESSELKQFQKHIQSLHSFSEKLYEAARFVANHVETATEIGVIFITPSYIGTNSYIFSKFLGAKLDTTHSNLRTHTILPHNNFNSMSKHAKELNLPCPLEWKVRQCSRPLFTDSPYATFPFRERIREVKSPFHPDRRPNTAQQQNEQSGDNKTDGLGDGSVWDWDTFEEILDE